MPYEALDKLKASLNRGVAAVSIKTASTLEKAKLRTHIDSVKGEADRLLAAAGEQGYRPWADGQALTPLEETFAAVAEKRTEIARLEAEYADIDRRDSEILGAHPPEKTAVCPACGAESPAGARFCSRCGGKLAE